MLYIKGIYKGEEMLKPSEFKGKIYTAKLVVIETKGQLVPKTYRLPGDFQVPGKVGEMVEFPIDVKAGAGDGDDYRSVPVKFVPIVTS